MTALDLLMSGLFEESILAYRKEIEDYPNNMSSLAGLSNAMMGAGKYDEAIPLKWRVHENNIWEIPDTPGQLLDISCAHWCLNDHRRAIELVVALCAGIRDRSIGMAPDLAGGATFGLVLHYMSVTAGDTTSYDYALDYLRRLNVKYDRRPTIFRYPVQTVKQLLGEMTFEDALAGATNERSLAAAYQKAGGNRSIKLALGVALFHDGALRRASGDEPGCMDRMRRVFDLGYQTESIRWQLARNEILRRQGQSLAARCT